MYTRAQFEELLKSEAARMSTDALLRAQSVDLIHQADRYHAIHQTQWLGEPCLQLPQDLFAIQQLIYRTQPDYIIELGVAWGGSLLFYASAAEACGKGKVIGVDTFLPADLRTRIQTKGTVAKRITLLQGSSTSAEVLGEVRTLVNHQAKVLVILDSSHTEAQVLAELRAYAPFAKEGSYLVVCSTIIEDRPGSHREKPWGRGNNPATAVAIFLAENPRFRRDEEVCHGLLLSCNRGGYLKCTDGQ